MFHLLVAAVIEGHVLLEAARSRRDRGQERRLG